MHTNAGHIPTNFEDYPDHIQERLGNCGKYIPYIGLDSKIKGWYPYSCNLKVCPKCNGYRAKSAMENHFYFNLAGEDWYRFTLEFPKAQTKADVDAFYAELDSTEEILNEHNVKYAEIFQVNAKNNERRDRIVAFFVPNSQSAIDDLEKKGTIKRVKKYAKELKKVLHEHVRLYDDVELNKYILKLGDENEIGKAFKKRVRKIGLHGRKSVDEFRKVPAVNVGGKNIAVIRQRDNDLQTKAEGTEIMFDTQEHSLYHVWENGKCTLVTFDELQKGFQAGTYVYEWQQYFPEGRIKKSARCKECKANIKEDKAAGCSELIIKLHNENMEKLSPSSQICKHTGMRCDFCARHRTAS